MSRHDRQRLDDIVQAMEAIDAHLGRGREDDPLSDGLVFDALRVRLIEVGQAGKDLDQDVLDQEPDRYFDTDHAIVAATCQRDPPSFVRRSTSCCS